MFWPACFSFPAALYEIVGPHLPPVLVEFSALHFILPLLFTFGF